MIKDKEWLKEQVAHEQNDGLYFRENYSQYDYFVNVEDLLPLIDQLDEPEKPQSLGKLIHKWECARDSAAYYGKERTIELAKYFNDFVGDLESLAIVEPSKPVIPQFVADYIEYYKRTGMTLCTWFNFVNKDEFERKTEEWIYSGSYEENLKREYLLIDAIRNGYEVEKEKKYRVVFRSHKDDLILFQTGEHIFIGAESANGGNWKQHFTESEIKAIDERYWAFAEEVTE